MLPLGYIALFKWRAELPFASSVSSIGRTGKMRAKVLVGMMNSDQLGDVGLLTPQWWPGRLCLNPGDLL